MVKVKKVAKKSKVKESKKEEKSCDCPSCRGEVDCNVTSLIACGEFAIKLALMAYSDGIMEKSPIEQLKKALIVMDKEIKAEKKKRKNKNSKFRFFELDADAQKVAIKNHQKMADSKFTAKESREALMNIDVECFKLDGTFVTTKRQ